MPPKKPPSKERPNPIKMSGESLNSVKMAVHNKTIKLYGIELKRPTKKPLPLSFLQVATAHVNAPRIIKK